MSDTTTLMKRGTAPLGYFPRLDRSRALSYTCTQIQDTLGTRPAHSACSATVWRDLPAGLSEMREP
jgi:hypothetical protein